MSRKKKGEKAKTEETGELEAPPVEATPAPSKAAAPAKKAAEKAAEVIPAVRIALLDEHASLPDRELILLAFAEHYRDAQTRAEQAAEEAKRAQIAPPEPPKSRRTRYVTNPQIPTPSAPAYTPPPSIPSYVAPAPIAATPAWEPEPEYAAPVELDDEPTPGPQPAMLMEDEGTPSPQVAFGKDIGDEELFGASALPSEDDIFSALGKSEASKDEELGFTPSSDYSDPFIRTASSSEPSDPFMPSFDQVVAAPVEEAAPNDRTMMIQAYNPPEDDAEVAAEPEAEVEVEAEAEAPTTGKKGRGRKKKK